jgi:ADP-heptose:LPS heptosyltransferase
MHGQYLIRNPRAARLVSALDAALALWHSNKRPPVVPARPRRILVADWTHIGNIVLALPLLRFLRECFPDVELGFVVGTWSQSVLDRTDLCDHVHPVDHFRMTREAGSRLKKIRRYIEMRRRAVAEMRAIGYEVGIDLSGFFPPVSTLFYSAGIPVRAGFTSGGFGPLLTHPVRWVHASRPISDYPRDLVRALWPQLDIPADAFVPCYPGHPRVALPAGLERGDYILVHMGTGAPQREWPEQNWRAVALMLAEDPRRLVFAGAGTREAECIRRVTAGIAADKVTVLVNRSWAEYVAIVAQAAHVIGLESSSAHVAAAFSVPTTVIFPGLNDPVQWGPRNPNARVLTGAVGCAPCHRGRGCEAMACIGGVTPDQVVAAVRSAMATV